MDIQIASDLGSASNKLRSDTDWSECTDVLILICGDMRVNLTVVNKSVKELAVSK